MTVHASRSRFFCGGRSMRVLAAVWLAATVAHVPMSAQSATTPEQEYQLKAVFLLNFVQFVDWPDTAFSGAAAPLCIGVLGDDPFGRALDDAIRGEMIRGRPLTVMRSQHSADLAGCHLVFISKSEGRDLGKALSQLTDHPVLTVSEVDQFAHRGGIIAFYSDGKKIRFEINPASASRAHLKISSELLRLGRIAGPGARSPID